MPDDALFMQWMRLDENGNYVPLEHLEHMEQEGPQQPQQPQDAEEEPGQSSQGGAPVSLAPIQEHPFSLIPMEVPLEQDEPMSEEAWLLSLDQAGD